MYIERQRKKVRHRMNLFKGLAHTVVEAGKSEIYRADWKAGYLFR